MTIVVKVGGHALDDLAVSSTVLGDLAHDLRSLLEAGQRVVVVHGGGPQIAELLARVGLESRFVDGLRVTDDATMRIVAMALAEVNLRVVAAFNQSGLAAVGLNGADASLFRATSLGEPWRRAAGAPAVRAESLLALLDAGFVPVVSSVALDEMGELLNCNADSAAGAVARALDAERLVLLSDVDQIRADAADASSALAELTYDQLRALVDSGAARDGMRPKAQAALAALEGGARVVTLANGARPHALCGALHGEIPTTEVTQ
jgi:acetylglutamate kinase